MANMKKLLLILALLLPVTAMAQSWTAPVTTGPGTEYPDRTPVMVTVNVNNVVTTSGLKLAVFVGNECRGEATDPVVAPTGVSTIYQLDAWGDSDTDAGKDITFRAFYNGVEYSFTTKTTFPADYSTITDITLNLDVVTGVKFTQDLITISKRVSQNPLPWTEDLSSYIQFLYGNNENYTPSEESSVVGGTGASDYTWSTNTPADISDQISFDGTNVTFKQLGTYNGITLTVTYNGSRLTTGTVTLEATAANVPVESISCSVESAELFTYDRFDQFLNGKVTITPEDATNKSYDVFVSPNDNGQYNEVDSLFTKGGAYTVTLRPTEDKTQTMTPATIAVTVWERPTQIAAKNATLNIGVNENVYDALIADTTLAYLPGYDMEYMKQDVTITFGEEGFVDPQTHLALKAGTVTARVTLTNGLTPSATAVFNPYIDVTLNIQSHLIVTVASGETDFVKNGSASTASPAYVYVTNQNNEPFDASKLTITFDSRYVTTNQATFPYAEQVSVAAGKDGENADAYVFTILPLFTGTDISFTVKYDGNEVLTVDGGRLGGTINISLEQQLANGWNWISVTNTSDNGSTVANTFTQDDLVEARSQQELVYNDPSWGLFGSLTSLTPDGGMYKVKTNKATSAQWGNNSVLASQQATSKAISKGYNWMNNPFEFAIPASQIGDFLSGGAGAAPFTPANGDMIITQDGFAQYDGSAWTASDGFVLGEGKGLVYYSTDDVAKTISYNTGLEPLAETSAPVKSRDARMSRDLGEEVFAYDPYAYADNMAMVAIVDGLENPEDYTVGVFVNDECRGRGRVVKDNIMFISAVGKSGEQMTFKLANNATGEIINLDSTMKYALRHGSLSAPVVLSGAEVTGIMETMADAQQSADENIYDLSGRRVDKMQKGIYIVNGKKVLVK